MIKKMNKQKLATGAVVAVLLVLGLVFPRGNTVVERVLQPFGSVSSLDGVDNPDVSIGGVRESYRSQPLLATSSRICNIKNPLGATSTVLSLGLKVTDGILGANTFSVSTSTIPYSTSTQYFMYEVSIGSNATGAWAWAGVSATSSSINLISRADDGQTKALVGPSEYLVWSLATTAAGSTLNDYMDGNCSAIFRAI